MSPKTLTGVELQLDDGPARESELFLVDGNNLAYRAFFALPEELATSDGFSTNALLGFTNMLFKLLADYRPKGVAVSGDKPAGQMSAQYGPPEAVIEHVDELSPARARNIREHADQARQSKLLATMRRDLDIDCNPGQLVLAPPDRSQLKEIFRRFEFRNLLNRVDELDAAVPAAPSLPVEGQAVAWRWGALPEAGG